VIVWTLATMVCLVPAPRPRVPSCPHLLEDVLVPGEIGDDLLQLSILIRELLRLEQLGHSTLRSLRLQA
jgi:hypothetical protein